jgi:hypothetical protein
VLDLGEVALAQTEEDRAVELGVAADEILLVRPERLPVAVVPLLSRQVALLQEHRPGVPILGLAPQVAASLQQQDALP